MPGVGAGMVAGQLVTAPDDDQPHDLATCENDTGRSCDGRPVDLNPLPEGFDYENCTEWERSRQR